MALDDWLQTLKAVRQQAIDAVTSLSRSGSDFSAAVSEIELNAQSASQWMERIAAKGYGINTNLLRVDEEYNRSEDYRRLINHLEHHLSEIGKIKRDVVKGNYKSHFMGTWRSRNIMVRGQKRGVKGESWRLGVGD